MSYTFQEAKKQINFYKRTSSPHWHNIVGSILKQIAEESGDETANRLIRECRLKVYGWKEEVIK